MRHQKLIVLLLALLALVVPCSETRGAAAGVLSGTVTDPKGAVIAGASVIVTDPLSNRSFTGETNAQGRFKIEGLPAGAYTVTISAKGFSDALRENMVVEDGQSATLDVKLEIAAIDAGSVTVAATKANTDLVYQQLRKLASEAQGLGGPIFTVNNLVLKRDAASFKLTSGELYFLAPIEGRTTGAVFIGEGELSLTPPTDAEKHSLKLFTDQPALTEQFSKLTLRFTDQTLDEVKNSPQATASNGGAQAQRARDLYQENQSLSRKLLHDNLELRTLADLYAPQRPGFFTAFIGGKRFSKLIYSYDPQGLPNVSPEEVMLFSYGDSDGGFWTAFHSADEYRKNTASSAEDHRLFDITRHEIDAAIRGTRIAATDQITFLALASGVRVLPFNLYRSLRVGSVRDERGRELSFIQESKDEDADFGVILPEALEAGKSYKLTIQYQGGDAVRDSGGGNFILIPRSSWYPNNGGTQFGDRAAFDMTFHYPKGNMLVATGALVGAETRDGDLTVAHWSSGQTDLAVAGFNYGRFKKKNILDKETGYDIEFYANEEVPDEIRQMQMAIEQAERAGARTNTTLGSISTAAMADAALSDSQNATRIYTAYFGKLPYTRIAMSQQPAAGFGQAWPTLVFMPYTAFIDATQRTQMMGVRGGTDNFWRYVGPHELAHQWWGHIIGWTSYRDQWMSEGFAEFSTSLYVQYLRRDMDKFVDFWNDQRDLIIQSRPATHDRKPYTVGPVTQGYRLNSGKTGPVSRFMIYPKGAYILHMLRMLMFKHKEGDREFQAMMRDFVKTYFNKDVSTEDFKRIVEKHMTPDMDLDGTGRMDWFFNQWVYGTEVPSYRFEYQLGEANGAATLSGRITQSGVSDNFKMRVPIYLDFGKGWIRFGSAALVGNQTIDLGTIPLPLAAKRAAISALGDVLALNIENSKR